MDLIETYFPDRMQISQVFKSFAFQPERISLNSQDDITGENESNNTFAYSRFTIRLAKPCLNVKSVQLLRCSIPTPLPSFPDNELFFFYYRLPTPDAAKTYQRLAFVRLLPSTWLAALYPEPQVGTPLLPGSTYGYNRSFTSYQDLVNELNLAATNDPCNGAAPGQLPNFYPGDITFHLDARTNRIYFTGNTAGIDYVPASFNDPLITVQTPGSIGRLIQQRISQLTSNPPVGAGQFNAANGQEYNPYRPLSLRLGWTWNNVQGANTAFQTTATGIPNYANTYADLVYSADCYIYVSFVGSSSLDSAGNSGLLSVVPLNTANNAVGFYNNVMANPLTKIPQQLFEVEVSLKDDAGNEFLLPNSAIVNLEIGLSYH